MIELKQMHKEIFKNTSFQILARGITTIIGFAITVLVARAFGVYGFGEFSKITSFIALFYLFADFGLNAIFLKKPQSFSSLFFLRIIISIFLIIFANVGSLLLPYNSILNTGFSPFVRMGIFIFSFTILSQGIIYSTSSIFQKKLRFDYFMISQIIGEIINFFIIVVLIFFAKSLELIIIAFVVSNFITAFLSLILAKEKISEFDFKYSKDIFKSSLPIGLMMVFNLIYFRIDIILLSIFKSNQDVGIYSLAYRFFDFFIALPLFLSNSIYPKLLETIKNKNEFSKITKNYFFIYLISSFVIIIPVWFLSPLFTLISPDYSASIYPFRVLIISLPIFFITSFLQWILISMDKQRFLMMVYFVAAIINVILNLMFIPKYSYFASSWITLIGEGLILVLLALKLVKEKSYLINER